MEDSTNYDLDDSYAMGLSYFSAVLTADEQETDLIEELMEPVELTGSLLQLNLVLLSKILRHVPEVSELNGPEYLELLREEHADRVAAKQSDGA